MQRHCSSAPVTHGLAFANVIHKQGFSTAAEGVPIVLLNQDKNGLSLCGDLLEILDRATGDFIPVAKDEHTRVSSGLGGKVLVQHGFLAHVLLLRHVS